MATIPRTAALADTALVLAWATLVLDAVWQTRRWGAAGLGQRWSPSIVAGIAAGVTGLAGAVVLERLTWRFAFRPGMALTGLILVALGVALHGWARRTLGSRWSPGLVPAASLVEQGPYAFVRHPIYSAGVLLAAGTLLAHPSPATVCIATGLTAGVLAKAWREDRTLSRLLGEDYRRYAARVPALVPRFSMMVRAVRNGWAGRQPV